MRTLAAVCALSLFAGAASADVVVFDAQNGLASGWTINQGFTGVVDFNGGKALETMAETWRWCQLSNGAGVDISQTPIMEYTAYYPQSGRIEAHKVAIPGQGWGGSDVSSSFSDPLLDGASINRWATYITQGTHITSKDLSQGSSATWFAANGKNLGELLFQMPDANTVEITDWRFVAVPEPASMGLLGLGSLLLVRRRK